MKRLSFIVLFALVSMTSAYAQWSSNGSKIYYNSGNVGIGASNPSAHLHIGQNRFLRVGEAYISSGGNYAHFANNSWYNGSSWKNIETGRTGGLVQIAGEDIHFYKVGSGSNPSFTNTLSLKGSGNVGVGIAGPTDRLHVYKNSSDSYIKITNSHYKSSGVNKGWRVGISGGTFHIRDHNNNGIFQIKEDLTITMGISNRTTEILGKLCVKPTPGTSCPDYVFEDDYELKTMEELKAYIETNKHLPGVKSAKEIEDAGNVDFIEMSYSLLEKVEELTLYTLKQNDEIKELKEMVKGQALEIEKLSNKQ